MLVFPGGGYKKLTMRKEGYSIANWAAENGIAAFVLKYRLDRKDALRDAQRAMSFIRSNAAEYNIDKDKIGTIGFSAGAHLSANLAINHDERENTDKIDAASAKPNFWIPIYGGFWQIFGQPGKFIPLNELPPTFIVHASNDSKAPVSSSINLFSRLHEQNVPVEMHIYAQGEHGFALERGRGETTTSTVDNWSPALP
jgi:Esterase/lipase